MPTRLMEFGAAPDNEFVLTAHDLGRGKIHRVEARSAETIDLNAGNGLPEARLDRCEPGDVGAGFADRIDHAEHDVIDDICAEVVALL